MLALLREVRAHYYRPLRRLNFTTAIDLFQITICTILIATIQTFEVHLHEILRDTLYVKISQLFRLPPPLELKIATRFITINLPSESN